MTPIIEKYIGNEELEQAISQNNYNDECFKEFISYLDDSLTELEQDGAIEEEDTAADLISIPVEYTNYYAQRRNEEYVSIYNQQINKGRSALYANKYASELVDVKRRYGICDDEESLGFAKSKAVAFINGWEYAENNKLEDRSRFIKCYEDAYLNTCYSDNPYEWKTIEECEKITLDKALIEYEKIIKVKHALEIKK